MVQGLGLVCCLGAGFLTLSGCASRPPTSPARSQNPGLAWPAPPDEPRIVFDKAISRPADAGIKTTALGRFVRWISGSDRGNEALVKPFGVALDENDNLCLTDTGLNTVGYWDRKRRKWHRWDKVGKLRFVSPVAVAKQKETFYVADSGLASVVAFGEDGKLRYLVTNRLERPSGITLLGERLFVTDSKRHCVVAFDTQGQFVAEFGRRGAGPGEFNFPTHIAAGPDGHLYVTDSLNSRIQILDASGGFQRQIGSVGDTSGHFSRPKGVAVDALGHVYVVDALFDNIQVFDREGRLLLYLGDAGAELGQFWLPNGIAISSHNEIFVADSYNRRVQVFKYVGQP